MNGAGKSARISGNRARSESGPLLESLGEAEKVTDEHPASPKDQERQDRPEKSSIRRDRVQVRERNGIWEVKVDGKFRGDYHQQQHALAAAALLKLSQ